MKSAVVLLWLCPGLAAGATVATGDGLVLGVGRNGAFEKLEAGGGNLLAAGGQSGMWVRDARSGEVDRFLGHVESRGSGLTFSGAAGKAGLDLRLELLPEKTAIRLQGAVESREGRERAVELWIRLDCDARGARWARDVQVSWPLGAQAPPPNTTYPFHGLALPGGAFALAVSPEEPALFEFAYRDNAAYVLKLKLGLSPHGAGRLHNRAPFQALLYRTDPAWGFRSVADRYYKLHEPWFHRRAMKNGLWLFYRPTAEEVPNPWDYAYHADIKEGWKEDKRQGLANLAYHLPGQREFVNLPAMPQTYADQMKVLETFQQKYTRHIAADSIYRDASLDRKLITSSGLHDSEGKFRAFTRTTEWGGPSLTFILNPSPALYRDRPEVTMGKLSLEWARWKLASIPEMDGLMVDSLFGWGRYFNGRRDHFPYAQIALSYDPETNTPAISNQFSHQEYLWALRELLGPRNGLLMGNGIRPGRFFNGMELDVLTSENPVGEAAENPIMGADTVGGGEKEEVGLVSSQFRNFIFARMAAHTKPFLIVDHHPEDWNDAATVETFWKAGTFFAVYPGFNWRYQMDPRYYERHQGIINRYLPVLRQLAAAGWEPITKAATDNRAVWIERYGETCLALLNVTGSPQSATVTLPEGGGWKAVELVEGKSAAVTADGKARVELGPGDVRVLRLAR